MLVNKSVSLDHKKLDDIEDLIENGKYTNFSDFVRSAIDQCLKINKNSFKRA